MLLLYRRQWYHQSLWIAWEVEMQFDPYLDIYLLMYLDTSLINCDISLNLYEYISNYI